MEGSFKVILAVACIAIILLLSTAFLLSKVRSLEGQLEDENPECFLTMEQAESYFVGCQTITYDSNDYTLCKHTRPEARKE